MHYPSGEPDECSVNVPLETDKKKKTPPNFREKRTEPSSISFASVSSVASSPFNSQVSSRLLPISSSTGELVFHAPPRPDENHLWKSSNTSSPSWRQRTALESRSRTPFFVCCSFQPKLSLTSFSTVSKSFFASRHKTCRNMRRKVHRCRFRLCHTSFFFCSCILFAIVLGAAYQAGILSAARRAEVADVEQMMEMTPFVTCEIAFGQKCLRVDVWYQCIEFEF